MKTRAIEDTPTLPRDEDGTYTKFAWPGGYPVFYIVADCGVLCADCANGPECRQAQADYPDDNQWRIIAGEINYEDPFLTCDNCGDRIESAYAEDENETTPCEK